MHDESIYILDDDPGIRAILTALLTPLGVQTPAFACADTFFAAFDPARPGCVLLDLFMPGVGGMEVLGRLAGYRPVPTVIVISGTADVPQAIQAIRAGAADFITKPFDAEQLIALVRTALAADRERRVRYQETEDAKRRFDTLTPRERDVMLFLIAGLRNKAIAQRMGISTRTVEVHRASVMFKMGAESVSTLALTGFRLADSDAGLAAAIAARS